MICRASFLWQSWRCPTQILPQENLSHGMQVPDHVNSVGPPYCSWLTTLCGDVPSQQLNILTTVEPHYSFLRSLQWELWFKASHLQKPGYLASDYLPSSNRDPHWAHPTNPKSCVAFLKKANLPASCRIHTELFLSGTVQECHPGRLFWGYAILVLKCQQSVLKW